MCIYLCLLPEMILFIYKYTQGWENSLSVQSPPRKFEDLSLDPQDPHENLVMVALHL